MDGFVRRGIRASQFGNGNQMGKVKQLSMLEGILETLPRRGA